MITNFIKVTSQNLDIYGNNKYSTSVEVSNFKTLSQIQFNCIDSSKINFIIVFIPSRYIMLDSSVGFNFGEKKPTTISNLSPPLYLTFVYIKGFELENNIFKDILGFYKSYQISLFYPNFFLFYQNRPIKNCSIIQNVKKFLFGITDLHCTFTTKYQTNMCPFIFSQSSIDNVRFSGLSNSFLNKNMLSFVHVNQSIQNFVDKLFLDTYRFELNYSVASAEIFGQANMVSIKGSLVKIEAKTFENFVNLKLVHLALEDFRFFFSNGVDWLNKVGTKSNYTLVNFETNSYFFGEEDLCLFKDFTYNPKIFFSFSSPLKNCTCTLMWLLRSFHSNSSFFNHFYLTDNLFTMLVISLSKVCWSNKRKVSCAFKERFKSCNPLEHIRKEIIADDFLYQSEFFNFLTLIFIPIVSITGLISDAINIKIIYNIFREDKEKKFIHQISIMMINSLSNLVYLIIYILHLMNKCIYPVGIFCSSINKNYFVQLFDVIFVEFFQNCLKTWSNVTIIILSSIRLAYLINDKLNFSKIKDTMEKRIKIAIGVFLVISFLLSVDKIFSVQINRKYLSDEEINYVEFPNKNTFQNKQIRLRSDLNIDIQYYGVYSFIFYTFFIINFLVNDVFLTMTLIGIDIVMLYFLRKQINLKKSLKKKKLNRIKGTNNTNVDLKRKKIATTIMINLFILFLLKFIHLCFSIYILIVKLSYRKLGNYCIFNSRICSSYLEFAELFYSISNIYTIVLFYNLNKKFNVEFKKMFFV